MLWALLIPTDTCPVHEMWPVTMEGEFAPGHVSGIDCPCRPCLDDRVSDSQVVDAGAREILFHHVLIDGKPLKSVEQAHDCRLR
jgi:hypothetical protein